jgi:uncharacterized phage protein (TIGR01671 family)
MVERRKYRFRAWHQNERRMFPVIMTGRGGVVIQDASVERTCPLSEIKLMQFSGLTDKNGREIYEGDILDLADQPNRCHVILENGSFRLVDNGKRGGKILTAGTISRLKARVVGNIYQD